MDQKKVGSTDSVSPQTRLDLERVLRVALELFTRDGGGYFNTSIHDIQRESGVSMGSLYKHFGGKEGIARALYDFKLNMIQELLADAVASSDRAKDVVRSILGGLLTLAERDPKCVYFILYARHREFLAEVAPICSADPFVAMRAILERGMKNGEIREMDPMVASASVYAPTLRLIQFHLDGILPCAPTQYLDAIFEGSWCSVAP